MRCGREFSEDKTRTFSSISETCCAWFCHEYQYSIHWVLISAALVLFMTPGLAFFYGGMVRSRHVLGMLMQNIFSMGIISVLWSAVGYSLAFGGEGSLIGDFSHAFLADTSGHQEQSSSHSLRSR